MTKRVLDVGQCVPDHASIRRLIEGNFDATVVQAHDMDDALRQLRNASSTGAIDLVLINRKLDMDYSDGIEILKQIKADPELASVPVMLVTNFPEHQQLAVQAGGEPGFGKDAIRSPETLTKLGKYLG